MKKTMRIVGFACVAIALLPLASCGDDDEGVTPPGENEIEKETGMRLSSVGEFDFTYDKDGRCILVEENSYYGSGYESKIVIDWNAGTITEKDGYEDEPDEVYHFKTNGKGYITELTQSQNYNYGQGVSYKVDGKAKFSYDKSGHLAGMELSSTASGVDEGEKFTEKINVDYSMKWENGNLVSAVAKEDELYDGDREYDEYNYDLTYSDRINTYHQTTLSTMYMLYDMNLTILGHVGMFGVGTENFPTHITQTDQDGDKSNYSIQITANSVGLITSEKINGSTYNYYYEGVDDNRGDRSMKSRAPRKSMKSLFNRHRKAAK